jgi:hypothetical protein
MTKIAGSGSISQRHGSADPDPYQNVMDPQHCMKGFQRDKKPLLEKRVSDEGADPLLAEVGGPRQPVEDLHQPGKVLPAQGIPHSKLQT